MHCLWLNQCMTKITKHMTYNGKRVATVAAVATEGRNYRVTFDNGYSVVATLDMLSEDVACLAQ